MTNEFQKTLDAVRVLSLSLSLKVLTPINLRPALQ